MSSNWSDVPSAKTASSSTADGEADLKSNAISKQTTEITPNETPKNGNYTTDTSLGTEHQQVIEIDCDELSDTESVDCEHENGALYESSPLEGSELERIASSLTRKTLKRNNAPGPLRISPKVHAGSTAPAINSAPMRSLYGPQALRRVPVRYLYPAMGHFPQTAVHYMPTPIRRTTGAGSERVAKPRLPRAMSARRRKPVLDVFEGQVAKLAPMPAQPPSAQIEHFDVGHSDEEKATQDEMDEMEIKRRRTTSALRGTISFNEESAFKFTIFQGNESNAKKKFLEVCETTWDKYMANSTGS
ncbi:hypothetical protein METBIDRAFT_10448 [Metschnikowia bicuspidata var. bicuspidata NRRL YB-4993]|uniref:Uncharacterized protein n=1 Tax=Metschnikowia bicuspidata var. bicuspidata NRRL YB-4993 TaxID=869754 RepID=A0A1A0HK83_9ASCO|nr:hypothetical protein METBIDRAFT_10448 [Metschnikowia bicuspidata var. bicuspidata NRRL YB-4993]OBA24297.1 hypothetical protein METBIDRAFT_10448 [Metschnikowia bicuspidata var. bicuspidata NRRL YB-4993]